MATTTEKTILELEQKVAGPAAAATSALDKLERSIAGSADAVRELEAQMRIMQAQGSVDIETYRALNASLTQHRAELAQAQAAYVAMGGAAKDASAAARQGVAGLEAASNRAAAAAERAAAAEQRKAEAAQKAADATAKSTKDEAAERQARTAKWHNFILDRNREEAESHQKKNRAITAGAKQSTMNMDALKNATGKLGGKMGPAGQAALELGENLGKLGGRAALIIAAIALVTAALVTWIASAVRALTAANALRTEFLGLQGALKGDFAAAKETQAAIDAVAASSSAARAKITGFAQELLKARFRGDELREALETMTIAAEGGGDEVARSFLAQAQAAKAAGQSVSALAAKFRLEYGGVARAKALDLNVQIAKLKENFDRLFDAAEVEPFLRVLERQLSILSQTDPIGRKLREVLGKAMTDTLEAAKRALPYIKEAIVGALIVAVMFYIWWKKIGNAIEELIGPSDEAGSGMEAALLAGMIPAGILLVALTALAVVLGVIAIAVLLAAAPFIILGLAIYKAIEAYNSIKVALGKISLVDIGSKMIDGLVEGIKGAAGRVTSALTGIATGAIAAMKGALDMHSPSKIFREDIAQEGIGDALVLGLEDSAPEVNAAMGDVADPQSIKASAKAARSGAGRPLVYIENVYVRDREEFRAMLEAEFEAIELDGAPA